MVALRADGLIGVLPVSMVSVWSARSSVPVAAMTGSALASTEPASVSRELSPICSVVSVADACSVAFTGPSRPTVNALPTSRIDTGSDC